MPRRTGMGGHQSADMKNDEWLTPPSVLAALGAFDLDPCAPVSPPWPMAARTFTTLIDGLSQPWTGRVWLNPPYGPPPIVGPWMKRMVLHNHGTALIFARTETELFFETVWDRATAVLFLRGRLYFHYVDGREANANAGAPSVLAAYGESDADILEGCAIDGQFLRL